MNFKNIPPITKILLIINTIVFLFTGFIEPKLGLNISDQFWMSYFQNPNFYPWQIITSMFTHANFQHFGFNMFSLWMFGRIIERSMGSKDFLKLYIFAGIGAIVLHQFVSYIQIQNALSHLPTDALDKITREESFQIIEENRPFWDSAINIFKGRAAGASGAIFGVLVAFGVLYPEFELMLIFLPIPIKAKFFIPIAIALELFLGFGNFSGDNVAHFAHLGGALIGYLVVKYWKKNQIRYY